MIVSVSNQVYVFLCTIIGGIVIGLVYDFFRILRRVVKTGSLVTFIQDLLYWIIAAVIMFLTVYYSNDGELRAYLFIGAILGILLYALLLSRAVMDSSLFLIKTVTWFIKALIFLFSYPIRMIWRCLKPVLQVLGRASGKVWKQAGAGSKITLSKWKLLVRTFRNIRKKI